VTKSDGITQVAGLSVGHWSDRDAATGCTVVLCPDGAVASADVRGGAPGTRETDLLRLGNIVDRIHAVLLTGGSAYGLDAAAGVMRWLEERGHGRNVSRDPEKPVLVPIVPAAVLFDLAIGRPDVRPGENAGYAACEAATIGAIEVGSVGAGTGATVAKVMGPERSLKGGIGTAAERTESGITVAALVAVNAVGEIIDPDTAAVVAGPRGEEPGSFVDSLEVLRREPLLPPYAVDANSTIGVVATDAALSKDDAHRLAVVAQTGYARAIRPAHTTVDGDTIFSLATGLNESTADILQLGSLAARAVERAVIRGVQQATGLAGVPSAGEWTAPS
jgi:L-aminopeptidase/D-esterase-like protein